MGKTWKRNVSVLIAGVIALVVVGDVEATVFGRRRRNRGYSGGNAVPAYGYGGSYGNYGTVGGQYGGGYGGYGGGWSAPAQGNYGGYGASGGYSGGAMVAPASGIYAPGANVGASGGVGVGGNAGIGADVQGRANFNTPQSAFDDSRSGGAIGNREAGGRANIDPSGGPEARRNQNEDRGPQDRPARDDRRDEPSSRPNNRADDAPPAPPAP